MKKYLVVAVGLVFILFAGCDKSNEYELELTPQGNVLERKLVFSSTNDLANISAVYPPGGTTQNGQGYLAKGMFGNTMPKDIGGAGSYTNLATTMGSAAFYLERFRGNDDLVTHAGDRLKA